jgi:hypothetical protein
MGHFGRIFFIDIAGPVSIAIHTSTFRSNRSACILQGKRRYKAEGTLVDLIPQRYLCQGNLQGPWRDILCCRRSHEKREKEIVRLELRYREGASAKKKLDKEFKALQKELIGFKKSGINAFKVQGQQNKRILGTNCSKRP